MVPRIGVVTGGGDCPGLNAVIRAVAKAAHRRGWKAIGIKGGYEGFASHAANHFFVAQVLALMLV